MACIRRASLSVAVLAVACGPGGARRTPDVLADLVAESRQGITLMESRALGEGPLPAGEERAALEHLRAHSDFSSYHLYFALAKQLPDEIRKIPAATRAAILCSALSHLAFLNDWGHLAVGVQEGPPALALIEAGEAALACLRPLLDDRRAAPFFGLSDATLASQYRRADFAYRYASRILGEQPVFDPDPAERDRAIERLKSRLPAP